MSSQDQDFPMKGISSEELLIVLCLTYVVHFCNGLLKSEGTLKQLWQSSLNNAVRIFTWKNELSSITKIALILHKYSIVDNVITGF